MHQHFLGNGHNGLVSDCEIVLIDKTDTAEPTRREAFWISKLKKVNSKHTEGEFITSHNGLTNSFRNSRYKHATELSKCVWH